MDIWSDLSRALRTRHWPRNASAGGSKYARVCRVGCALLPRCGHVHRRSIHPVAFRRPLTALPCVIRSGARWPRALLMVRLAECAVDVVEVEGNPHDDAVRDGVVAGRVEGPLRLEDAVGAVVVREVSVGVGVDRGPGGGVEGEMVG